MAKFCAATAFRLAKAKVKAAFTGDDSDVKKFEEEIGTKFDTCDARWADTVAAFVKFKLSGGSIPYRVPAQDNSFVIDGRLPANAKVAIIGDWGTGEEAAKAVLGRIAVHL